MNKVFFIGRLTKDPVLGESADGKSKYCNFSLAIDRFKGSGERETDFPNITVFGKSAENLVKYTEKGNQVAVEGSFRTSKYEKDGKIQYRDNIIANRVEFLSWKKSSSVEAPAPVEADAEALPF